MEHIKPDGEPLALFLKRVFHWNNGEMVTPSDCWCEDCQACRNKKASPSLYKQIFSIPKMFYSKYYDDGI